MTHTATPEGLRLASHTARPDGRGRETVLTLPGTDREDRGRTYRAAVIISTAHDRDRKAYRLSISRAEVSETARRTLHSLATPDPIPTRYQDAARFNQKHLTERHDENIERLFTAPNLADVLAWAKEGQR